MTEATSQSQTFLTDFSARNQKAAPARPKTKYSAEEVEEIRQRAFVEGQQSVEARAAEDQALTVGSIATQLQDVLGRLDGFAFAHKKEAYELALAVSSTVAGRALDMFPDQAIEEIIQTALEVIPTTARIEISVPERLAEPISDLFTAHTTPTPSPAISILSGDDYSRVFCELKWDTDTNEFGVSSFDPKHLTERINSLVHDHLCAEEPIEGQLDLFSVSDDATQ